MPIVRLATSSFVKRLVRRVGRPTMAIYRLCIGQLGVESVAIHPANGRWPDSNPVHADLLTRSSIRRCLCYESDLQATNLLPKERDSVYIQAIRSATIAGLRCTESLTNRNMHCAKAGNAIRCSARPYFFQSDGTSLRFIRHATSRVAMGWQDEAASSAVAIGRDAQRRQS